MFLRPLLISLSRPTWPATIKQHLFLVWSLSILCPSFMLNNANPVFLLPWFTCSNYLFKILHQKYFNFSNLLRYRKRWSVIGYTSKKTFAAKPDNLNLTFETHIEMEGENWAPHVFLWPLQLFGVYTHTHTRIKLLY